MGTLRLAVVSGAGVAVLGGLGAWYALARGLERTEPPPVAAEPNGKRATRQAPADHSSLLLAELGALKARLQALEGRAAPERVADDEVAREAAAPEPPPNPADAYARQSARRKEVDGALGGEAVDPAWSRQARAGLVERFEQAGLSGTTLDGDVTCAKTMCRMVAVHESAGAQAEFEEFAAQDRMGTMLLFQDRRVAPNRPSDADHLPVETVAYFIREGFDSGDHPARVALDPRFH